MNAIIQPFYIRDAVVRDIFYSKNGRMKSEGFIPIHNQRLIEEISWCQWRITNYLEIRAERGKQIKERKRRKKIGKKMRKKEKKEEKKKKKREKERKRKRREK